METSRQLQVEEQSPRPVPPVGALASLAHIAEEVGNSRLARDAAALAQRVADRRFFVACIGQFKRGKSSLLNALVGTQVLPTGVVPVTAIVTMLRYGSREHAEVHFETGALDEVPPSAIVEYVSEARNPGNLKGVAAVEVFVPSPLLASGMCLVDTPGIGSVFAANTAVTRQFVPHIDAALVVLGADPPISGEELALIEELASQLTELIFVFNKVDRLIDKQSAEALEFCRHTVSQRIGRDVDRIFRVSASEWLDGAGPSRDAPALLTELERIARESGPALVAAAKQRGIKRLKTALAREIAAQRNALLRPVQDSAQLVARLCETIANAERSLSDLSYLFKAEHERVAHKCLDRRDRFLSEAIPAARAEFHQALASSPESGSSALRARCTTVAQEISKRLLDRWLGEERPAAEALYRQSAQRFIALANDFLRRLADSADPALADLPQTVTSEAGFRVGGRPYFGDHFGFPRRGFQVSFLDLLRTRTRRLEVLESEVVRYLDNLLTLNSTRALNGLDHVVRESSRRLEAEIRSLLKELRATAENTLVRAQRTHAAGTDAVRDELGRLKMLQDRLDLVS